MSKTSKNHKAAPAPAVPMPLEAAAYAEVTAADAAVSAENTVTETVAAVAKATTDVAELIANRAAKWGFGQHVDAYLESVRLQKASRKARGTPEYAALHAAFREINRDKKRKYGQPVTA